MATNSSRQTSAQQAKLAQRALLDSLVGIVTKHVNEQVLDVMARMVSALLDLSEPGIDARVVYQRVKSANLLKENSYAFIHLAATELESNLRAAIDQLLPVAPKARACLTELTLVPFEEMDNRVAFDVISRPFELLFAAQIATLNLRLGVLLEREVLRLPQNPFRPEVFLMVVQQAWHAFEPDAQGHALIQPLLRPDVLFDLGPMYDALVAALISKGAGDAYQIKKTDGAAAAKTVRARQKAELARQLRQFLADDPAAGLDDDIPLIPDLPASANSGAGGWRPSGAQGYAASAAAAPAHAAMAGAAQSTGVQPLQATRGESAGMHPAGMHPAGAQFTGHQPAGLYPAGFPANGAGMAQPAHGFVPASGGSGAQQSCPAGAQVWGDGPAGAYTGPISVGGPGLAQAAANVPMVSQAPLLELLRTLQARAPEQFAAAQAGRGTVSGPGSGPGAGQPGSADVFYLPRLKDSVPKGSLSRRDESTIDLLSKVFDTVFLDPNIPAEIRDLIHYLQIPVLKAALADNNFFFEEAHPARRMIDLMSRIGMEQRKAPDDPLFQAMQRSVDRIGRDAASDSGDEATGFSAALADLEASVQADDSVAESAIAAPIAAALKQEKHTAATRAARHAVAARVGSGEVVAMLETFLENRWTSVLTVAYTVEDDKPGAVNNATKTMDDLIWSVKPKITQDQRKALIARLPGLLATLNRWLDVIRWQDEDRVRFFAELAECHASIVRAPLDISPERQLEIAVEVAQQDALRRLEKEQAAAAIAVAVDPLPELDIDDAAVAVESLERSQWFEFTQPDGSARKVKLAWISPLRTLFIFSTGARQEAFSVPVEQLLEAFRHDKVKLLRVDGLVGRALSEALGQGAGNDPTAGADPGAAAA